MNNENDAVSVKEIIQLFLRKLWLIIGLSLVLGSAYAYHYETNIPSQYTSYSTMVIGKPADYKVDGISITEVRINREFLSTYTELAKSTTVLTKIIQDLNLGLSPSTLRNRIAISLMNDSELIKITVRDYNPDRAALIANKMVEVFMGNVSELLQISNTQVVDPAVPSRYPIRASILSRFVIGATGGIALSIFIILLLNLFDHKIRSKEALETKYGYAVIATIPYER